MHRTKNDAAKIQYGHSRETSNNITRIPCPRLARLARNGRQTPPFPGGGGGHHQSLYFPHGKTASSCCVTIVSALLPLPELGAESSQESVRTVHRHCNGAFFRICKAQRLKYERRLVPFFRDFFYWWIIYGVLFYLQQAWQSNHH